ncbi:transposable element Tc3 transposase [Trichonephila clavipes]|nr:transposable element Tc3 transposase [Trichonephila clavipes]
MADKDILEFVQSAKNIIHAGDENKLNSAAPVPISSKMRNIRKNSRLNRFVEWAQTEIAVVPDFHKQILFSDEAHFWLNGYVNKQNCRIWSEANPQVYVGTPLHREKLTVWCALWAGSCDLTPLDYFLWGYVKSLVYVDKPQTLDHLEDNIHRVIADTWPQMLEKVIENWTSRLDYIRASRGSPMPEMIFKI